MVEQETSRQTLQEDETANDQNSIDDSLEENKVGNNKLIDIKDDKQIVNSAAQNERYCLVERPAFLLYFEVREQENSFFISQMF